MNLVELQERVEALKSELAELREADRTLEAAKRILEIQGELKDAEAQIGEFEAAEAVLAELDAAGEGGEEDAGAEDGAGEGEGGGDAGEPGDEGAGEGEGDAAQPESEVVEIAAAPVAEADGGATVEDREAELALVASAQGDEDPGAVRGGFTLTASASNGGVKDGQDISDREQMVDALNATMTAAARPGRDTRGGSIVSVNQFTASDRDRTVSNDRGAIENTRIMDSWLKDGSKPTVLTAAACFCGPDEAVRDIVQVGLTERPVASLFASGPVRGRFNYVRSLSLTAASATDAVGVWTCTDQDGVDPADDLTWKPCAELDCYTEINVEPYMIKGCTTVSLMHRFAHPEQIDAWINKLRVDYARKAEMALLDEIEADAGTALTVGGAGDTMAAHGILSQVYYGLGAIDSPLHYEHRTDGLEDHVLLVPKGFISQLVVDARLRGFDLGQSRADIIASIERDLGARIVERRDESTAKAAGYVTAVGELNDGGDIDTAATPTIPPAQRLYLIDTSQWRHGQGTLVSADWNQDTNLIRQNMIQYFWENMEFLERVGERKSHIIDIHGSISGARTDLVAGPAFTAGL